MSRKQTTLSQHEREELARNEAVIERGFHTFLEVGSALMAIKKNSLYRQTHQSFEDYCRERFDLSRMHAHRQIRAVEICGILPNGDTPRPSNESQLRPLMAVPSEKAPILWLKAVKQAAGKRITGTLVQRVVNNWKRESEGKRIAPRAQWQELCLKHLRAIKRHVAEEHPAGILDEIERLRVLVEGLVVHIVASEKSQE